MKHFVALAFFVLSASFTAANAQTQNLDLSNYTFTHIDVPGAAVGPAGSNGTLASGINDLGQVVGSYADSAGNIHGFLRNTSGGFTTIDVPGNAGITVPTGINNDGHIVGWYSLPSGLLRGFLYSGGSFSNIDMTTFPCAVVDITTQPTGISNNDHIVGNYGGYGNNAGCPPTNGNFYSGIFLDLADVGGGTGTFSNVAVNGVNNSGQMVGSYSIYQTCPVGGNPFCGGPSFAFLGAPGTPFTAPYGFSGGFSTRALGIDDNSDVVGAYYPSVTSGNSRGFIYSGGLFTRLDPPDNWGAYSSAPTGINTKRQIVGSYVDVTGNHSFLATPNCTDVILKVFATGANIDAGVKPAGGLTLQQLAQRCGFVGFDWVQKVTQSFDPSEFYAWNIGGAFDPSIVGPVNLDSSRTPYNDPPQGGGYTYQNPPSFAYPFYYNAFPLGVGICQVDDDLGCYILDGIFLTFHDAPADRCLPGGDEVGTAVCNHMSEPPGSFNAFTTHLAGIKADGSPTDLGIGFTWTSDYNGSTGGVSIRSTNLPADGNGTGGVTITSVQGGVIAPVDAITILIKIKPPSLAPIPINPRAQGVIPVAVLTTTEIDASTVDGTSVRFGPTGAQSVSTALEDVNGDGKLDLVLHFETDATGISCGDTRARLTGKTASGQLFFGSEPILTVGCP